MRIRVTLRAPLGDQIERDIVDGKWALSSGDADVHLGQGLWALPGLVDAHSHLPGESLDLRPGDYEGAVRRAKTALGAGVMLLLDKGWSDATTIEVLENIPMTERPDIEAAARMISIADGYYPAFALEIEPSSVDAAVASQAVAGAGWVKLVGDWPRRGQGPLPNFTEDQLRLAVQTAEAAGAKVAIHTMAPDVPTAAVAAGVHSIEHGLFLEEDDLGYLGARGGMWVPTVSRVEAIIAQLGEESGGGKLLGRGLENVRRLLPFAIEAGVHVLTGTDLAMAPEDVAVEAVKLAECGLSTVEALRAVAISPFEATGRTATFDVGAPANAVLFEENPLEDLQVLATPTQTIRLGVVW